eukprot:IDg10861t1
MWEEQLDSLLPSSACITGLQLWRPGAEVLGWDYSCDAFERGVKAQPPTELFGTVRIRKLATPTGVCLLWMKSCSTIYTVEHADPCDTQMMSCANRKLQCIQETLVDFCFFSFRFTNCQTPRAQAVQKKTTRNVVSTAQKPTVPSGINANVLHKVLYFFQVLVIAGHEVENARFAPQKSF